MKTSMKIAHKAVYLVLATGMVVAPVVAFAQQDAVAEYNQYLESLSSPSQVRDKYLSTASEIERLNLRIDRLESQQKRQARLVADRSAHGSERRTSPARSD